MMKQESVVQVIDRVFSGCFELAHRVDLFIPTDPPGSADMVERAKLDLARWFGGSTAQVADGGYIMADGRYVGEPVQIVWSLADADSLVDHAADLLSLARRVAVILDQESVLVIIDGKGRLVSA